MFQILVESRRVSSRRLLAFSPSIINTVHVVIVNSIQASLVNFLK